MCHLWRKFWPLNKKTSPKIIAIDKDNVNLEYRTLSTCSSYMLKRIPMLLKNNFQDNRTLEVLSHPSHRCHIPSDDVVGSKTTGLPKDSTTDIPDGINSWFPIWIRDSKDQILSVISSYTSVWFPPIHCH